MINVISDGGARISGCKGNPPVLYKAIICDRQVQEKCDRSRLILIVKVTIAVSCIYTGVLKFKNNRFFTHKDQGLLRQVFSRILTVLRI